MNREEQLEEVLGNLLEALNLNQGESKAISIDDALSTAKELLKPKQWEPKEHENGYYINSSRLEACPKSCTTCSKMTLAEVGNLFPTEEAAQKRADQLWLSNRIYQYVLEHAPDWEPNWDDDTQNYYLYVTEKGIWEIEYYCNTTVPGVTCMPYEVAEKLLADIKSGVFRTEREG